MYIVNHIINALVHRFYTISHEYLALQLFSLVSAQKVFYLSYERPALLVSYKLRRLYGVYQQLKLRKLKVSAGKVVSYFFSSTLLYIHAESPEHVKVVVQTFSLGIYTISPQCGYYLAHGKPVLIVGILFHYLHQI